MTKDDGRKGQLAGGSPPADEPLARRNTWGFGLGTLGRDMVAAMVTMFLMVYLTEVLDLTNSTLAAVTVVLVVLRVFDAVNDPVMGLIVDNTRSRFGKFKPWIAGGAVAWALGTALLFTDFGLEGVAFVLAFTACYLVWEIAYTVNDISYYGMVPALSRSQSERERIGVVARLCANIGMFAVVVGIVPITNALEDVLGSATSAWLVFAVAISVIMLAFQTVTLVATRQRVGTDSPPPTRLSELFAVIARNDQLLWVTAAMFLFMTGFTATAGFGLYYFTYIYGDEGMYAIFAAILGITQIAGLLSFPLVAAKLTRRQVFTLASGVCGRVHPLRLCRHVDRAHRHRRGRDLLRAGLHPAAHHDVHRRLRRIRAVETRPTQRIRHLLAATVPLQGGERGGERHRRAHAHRLRHQ